MMIKNNFKIKQLAEFITLQYEEKVTPLEKIILDENLRVFYDCYEDTFDGMTIFDNNKFYIHLNTDRGNYINSEKGRFTLAHELGHYFIDTHRIGLKKGLIEPHPSCESNIKQYAIIEREADYFASCLLMPEMSFCKDITGKKFSAELLNILKDEFMVSRSACALRFADIGNCPILVVYAANRKIIWTYSSDDFRYKCLRNDNIVPQNTVMGEYFCKNDMENIRKTETVWSSDWFKYVKDAYQEKFYEYCFPHQDQAVSVIWED